MLKENDGDNINGPSLIKVPEWVEKVNILSIPSGLYGFEIKPSSFYLSSSGHKITDDSLGNLIISEIPIEGIKEKIGSSKLFIL